MLGWRIGLGTVLVAALIGILALDRAIGPAAPLLCVLTVLLVVRSVWELVQLLRTRSMEPRFVPVALCGIAVTIANWLPWWLKSAGGASASLGALPLAFGLSAAALFACAAWRYQAPGRSMETVGAELLILTYVGLFSSLTAQLRWVGFAGDSATDLGYVPLGSLIVTVKCGDTAAYFIGRALGSKKLAPLLSPGKTWAGAWGALVGAPLGAWAWLVWGTRWLAPGAEPGAWYWAVLFGLVVGLVGMIGDLVESLIKRDVGVKDSAPLMPGFGGLLDLLDSVIFAGPAAYVLWLVLPLAR